MGFPGGASGIKNRSANAGDIRDVGQKDPLEEGMITHSSILAWRIPIDRRAWWATVHEELDMTEQLSTAHSKCP